ncbi:MAG: DUF4476 domain-containing protein [Flavobacteriales bacterium]|nr:DUF4476 domain-containing protein [Flavobacteriales bacterium]
MRYVFLLSFFVSSLSVNAQNCRGPMNPRMFQSELQQLRALPQESARFRTAMQQFGPFCLSSAQVYQVCRLLGQDPYRIDFAYASYQNVTDPQNFYDVYDSFQLFSSAFRLHDLVVGEMTVELVPIPQPAPTPEPAPIPQPVCEVSPQDMAEITQLVKAATFKDSMEKQAKMMIKSKQCFRADQIVEILNVLTYDDSKLAVAKYAFDYCIDTQNYYRVVNSFTFKSYKDDLTQFIEARN